jgi:FkbM family methyltransferase
MYQQLKSVFSRLQDDISRKIFLYRLGSALSGEYESIDYWVPSGRDELKASTLNFLKTIVNFYGCPDENKETAPKPFFNFLLEYSGHKKVVIYGSGSKGQEAYKGLKDWGINVECFCDSDKNRHDTMCCGIPVISPETLVKKYIHSIIIISVWTEKSVSKIVQNLLKCGFKTAQLVSTFNIYDDQYFCYPFFSPIDNEIYLDIGCFNGNSIADYIKSSHGRYKKILGFEPDTFNLKMTADMVNDKKFKNVEIIPKGAWSSTTELYFTNAGSASRIVNNGGTTVPVTKIDDVLSGYEYDNILIKMDIEGAELDALKGAECVIRNNKPRLAICIYHKPEDIIDIPVFLSGLVPEYRFFIRHNNLYSMTETVLFASVSRSGGGGAKLIYFYIKKKYPRITRINSD